MGMNLDAIIYLQRHGYLTQSNNRLLDIGPQTIYFARAEQIREIVERQGQPAAGAAAVERLVHFSTPRPGERTTMLSEIADLAAIEYEAIDVCPGLKNTNIIDLNFDAIPEALRGASDVVLNFGTTEHILNQWNCFEVMHDAAKVGGVIYHQLPASGYLDHGYFCYTPLFFRELAHANGYSIEFLAVTYAGENRIDALGLTSLEGDTVLREPAHLNENNRVPQLNVHVVLKKTTDESFRPSLEIATSHSPVNERMRARYSDAAQLQDRIDSLQTQLNDVINSRLWRTMAPLRQGYRLLRRAVLTPSSQRHSAPST
ncbi:hypothetical protein ACQR16_05700 [Bradyrhizobium oligotrophicum]|uniref:hypothetical protein n=1 Tax=Bradyrhizobium oligotrophicum TaxID=44255 RepID=UPI003EB7799A